MSHFTYIKTRFQNLFYLEKALNRLNITYKQQEVSSDNHVNLIIPQSNGYDVSFCWNGKEYDLIADLNCWEQSYSTDSFIDQVSQQYAGEVVIGESQKTGFQPVKYQQNSDGSNTIVLERWK